MRCEEESVRSLWSGKPYSLNLVVVRAKTWHARKQILVGGDRLMPEFEPPVMCKLVDAVDQIEATAAFGVRWSPV